MTPRVDFNSNGPFRPKNQSSVTLRFDFNICGSLGRKNQSLVPFCANFNINESSCIENRSLVTLRFDFNSIGPFRTENQSLMTLRFDFNIDGSSSNENLSRRDDTRRFHRRGTIPSRKSIALQRDGTEEFHFNPRAIVSARVIKPEEKNGIGIGDALFRLNRRYSIGNGRLRVVNGSFRSR